MNRWTKAIIIGTAIEGIFFSLMAASEFGPCGPATSAGFFLILVHLPAFVLMMPFALVEWPEWMEGPMLFVFASLFWSLVAYGVLLLLSRRPK